jgi:hypothetical protein
MGIGIGDTAFGLTDVITKAGREKRETSKAQRKAAEQMAAISQEVFDTTGGLREGAVSGLEGFLQSGDLPEGLTQVRPDLAGLNRFMDTGRLPTAVNLQDTYAPVRDTLERQFRNAREATIGEAGAQGGALAQSLTDLQGERALGVTSIEAQRAQEANALRQRLFGVGLDIRREQAQQENALRQQLFGLATTTGFGQAPVALGGLGGAAGQFGNIAARAMQEQLYREEATKEKVGTIAGFAMGGMGGGAGGGI